MIKPLLTMLIGYPRSGKTTEAHARVTNEVIISADTFRKLMYGQRFYKGGEKMMWAVRDICIRVLMQQATNIILDETNINAKTRAEVIRLAKEYGYDVEAVWIDTPAPICKQRARTTDQADLVDIITHMQAAFDPPEMSEGFKRIAYVGDDEHYKEAYLYAAE